MSATSDWIFGRNPDHGNWVLILLKSGRACVGRFIQKNNSWRTSGMSGPLSSKSVQCWAEIIKPDAKATQ